MNSELVLSALDDVAAAFCVLRNELTRRRARWLVQRLQEAVRTGEFAVEVEEYTLLRGWVALTNSVEATEDREKLRGLLRRLRYYAKRRLERLPPQQRPVAQMLLTLADLLEENESRMLLVSATIKRRN